MGIIIRPSYGVFGRNLPLVLVFGTYRCADDPPLDDCDRQTIAQAVQFARKIRAPLSILRELRSDGEGAWMEGCRPRVTDRVFDHPQGSAFENKEFLSVFSKVTHDEVVAIGPRNDSSLRLTLLAPEAQTRPIRAIVPNHPLQKCSAGARNGPVVLRSATTFGSARDLPLSRWCDSLVERKNWETNSSRVQ